MALNFGNSASAMANTSPSAALGPELEIIQTEALGFRALAGDAKIQLTSPWSSKPPSAASLLSVASRKGLVAAAGPDGLVIASTESVRKAFDAPKEGDSDVRGFAPQVNIPLPMRVSQLAFTADETYLIMSAESGGGIAAYDAQALVQGNTQTAFELATNGESLRVLLPNPTSDKAELCAIVTDKGNLHMANLKERVVSNVLKTQVSSISWSNKGKQLVAGLADGTINRMTPEGEIQAEIPKPPDVGNYHVSALVWLENNVILAIHTATDESPPSSIYHIITRQPPTSYTFNKITDPVDPFGSDEIPHHFILRLKDFPPSLQDLLIVASTASPDVGLLSRSSSPLATDKPADSIINTFTMTEMADDSRRATLPMTEDFQNAVPVGCALDLSAKETVYKPIPTEEIEESPGPVPGYWVLTNEGVLCSWWVIYGPSIKGGTTYPGMATLDSSAQAQPQATTPTSTFGKPAAANGSAFGSSSAAPGFGGPSALGSKPSPWGTPSTPGPTTGGGGPAFGSTSFGSTPAASTPAFGKPSAFGLSSALGVKTSPWASAAPSTTTPTFGQSGFAALGSATSNAFTATTAPSSSSGFAGFANKSGFASAGSAKPGGSSIFGDGKPLGSAFGQSSEVKTAFPPPQKDSGESTGVFGSSTPFKLKSSFKPDPAAKDEEQQESAGASGGFGTSFENALDSAAGQAAKMPPTPPSKEEEMDAPEQPFPPTPQPKSIFSVPSTTPTTTPAPSRFSYGPSKQTSSIFGAPSGGDALSTKTGSIFGAPSAGSAPSTKTGSIFGAPSAGSAPSPKTSSIFGAPSAGNVESPKAGGGLFGTPAPVKAPQIKVADGQGAPEPPLPPEPMSRNVYPRGDSSSSTGTLETGRQSPVKADDAPLPPDFITTPKASATQGPAEDAPLPPDFLASPATSKPSTRDSESARFPPALESTTPPKPAFERPKSNIFGTPEEAPLPPSFTDKQPRVTQVPAIPESEEDSGLSEEEGSDEGSGVDVGKDFSPSASGLTHTPGMTPQSSFGGIGGSTFLVNKPNQEPTRSLFGEVGRRGPIFPPPAAGHSPRSPSPIRPPRPIGLDSIRSVSAPGMASQMLGSKRPPAPSALGTSILGKGSSETDSLMLQQRQARERREAEETQPLVDEEADEIQHILAEEVESSLEIDQFIAHTDVAGPAQKSIPAQVEAVFRDINAMIDTLGLNARSVKAFVKGHSERSDPEPRSKDDLEIAEDWVLCELEDLSDYVIVELFSDLQGCRVRDVEEKKAECVELARNLSRLRAKQHDLELMFVRFDPEQAEATRHLPLSAEQAAQQGDLRREFAAFSKVLSETEEAVTLLKTKLASAGGGASGRGPQPPTVDAVLRTIAKMTHMVEKRSGDVDVLENQMRRLRVASTVASREGTPMSPRTPKRSTTAFGESLGGGGGGTPRSSMRNSLMAASSMSPFKGSVSAATPTRRKMSGYSDEEKRALMERRAQKLGILGKLRSRVEEKGVTVWTMDELE